MSYNLNIGVMPQTFNNNYVTPVNNINSVHKIDPVDNKNIETKQIDSTSASKECETCKTRKYVDGSNEGNVSFKAPGHISPSVSGSVVMSHEQEHVSNAKKEGSKEGNQLISATVSLKVAICPECGKSYVAGGETKTTIKYSESNPYESARKTIEGSFLAGQNIDAVA